MKALLVRAGVEPGDLPPCALRTPGWVCVRAGSGAAPSLQTGSRSRPSPFLPAGAGGWPARRAGGRRRPAGPWGSLPPGLPPAPPGPAGIPFVPAGRWEVGRAGLQRQNPISPTVTKSRIVKQRGLRLARVRFGAPRAPVAYSKFLVTPRPPQLGRQGCCANQGLLCRGRASGRAGSGPQKAPPGPPLLPNGASPQGQRADPRSQFTRDAPVALAPLRRSPSRRAYLWPRACALCLLLLKLGGTTSVYC